MKLLPHPYSYNPCSLLGWVRYVPGQPGSSLSNTGAGSPRRGGGLGEAGGPPEGGLDPGQHGGRFGGAGLRRGGVAEGAGLGEVQTAGFGVGVYVQLLGGRGGGGQDWGAGCGPADRRGGVARGDGFGAGCDGAGAGRDLGVVMVGGGVGGRRPVLSWGRIHVTGL